VSRIKIDPQLTGVDNTPETHITEQQLSREITLTYVTNLASTQQQIVQVEWSFSRDWSVYAARGQGLRRGLRLPATFLRAVGCQESDLSQPGGRADFGPAR
jgi:translocation and assembly module TamB